MNSKSLPKSQYEPGFFVDVNKQVYIFKSDKGESKVVHFDNICIFRFSQKSNAVLLQVFIHMNS